MLRDDQEQRFHGDSSGDTGGVQHRRMKTPGRRLECRAKILGSIPTLANQDVWCAFDTRRNSVACIYLLMKFLPSNFGELHLHFQVGGTWRRAFRYDHLYTRPYRMSPGLRENLRFDKFTPPGRKPLGLSFQY